MEHIFQVGYARADMTPTEPVPLAGYGNTSKRMSQNILSPLITTCIAFSDGENTVLMYHNDICTSPESFCTPARQAISDATGVPFQNIMISATHNHSSPDLKNLNEPSMQRYIPWLQGLMVTCAREAIADLKPATMETGKVNTKNLNFVRHYICSDGDYKGDNFGTLNPNPYVGHTTIADPEMRIVKFIRQDQPDIWMVNWQTHPHRTGGEKKYDVSADIVGSMRDALEQQTGCKFIYFSGGSGNVNPGSRIKGENITADYLDQGNRLAQTAMCAQFHPVKTGKVRLVERIIDEPLNRPTAEKLEEARIVQKHWFETNDIKSTVHLSESFGINSPFAANAMISRYNATEDTVTMPMYAISIGDVALITAPYEMFDTNAKYIRDNSPFETTMIVTCANSQNSYIPSAYGFIHGCYEADCTRVYPGTGERYANLYIDMLNEITQ